MRLSVAESAINSEADILRLCVACRLSTIAAPRYGTWLLMSIQYAKSCMVALYGSVRQAVVRASAFRDNRKRA